MQQRKFDVALLQEMVQRHSIKLIGSYENPIVTTKIKGYCISIDCKNTFDKAFRFLMRGGPYCKKCVIKNRLDKSGKTNLKKYGCINPFGNADIKEQIKQTCMERYGVPYSAQVPHVREKQKQTCMKKYGTKHPFGNAMIQEKINQTNIKKYGTKHPMQNSKIHAKMKQTCFQKYGTEYPMQNSLIQAKMKQTNLKKYGYENAMYNSMIAERAGKNAYKSYDYIFPSGNKIRIQGYENFGIDYLLTVKKYTEEQIVTGRLRTPSLWWVDDNDKRRRHYVDIFLPHKNKCIEIKSTRTFELHKDKCILKMANAILAGFDYEIWVFDQKGKRLSRYVYRK